MQTSPAGHLGAEPPPGIDGVALTASGPAMANGPAAATAPATATGSAPATSPAAATAPVTANGPDSAVSAGNRAHADLTPLPWRRVLAALSIASLLVVLASWVPTRWPGGGLLVGGGEWHHIFDVGSEQSVATAWSAAIMVSAAVLCAVCAWLTWRQGGAPTWPWVVLGTGLALFAIDEAASLHERLPLIVAWLGIDSSMGYVWLVLGIPIAIAVIIVVVLCAIRLPRTARVLVIAGVLVFFAGGIVVEGITGQIHANRPDVYAVWFSELIHAEELLEKLGICLALCAPLSALRGTPRGSGSGELRLAVATR